MEQEFWSKFLLYRHYAAAMVEVFLEHDRFSFNIHKYPPSLLILDRSMKESTRWQDAEESEIPTLLAIKNLAHLRSHDLTIGSPPSTPTAIFKYCWDIFKMLLI